jgi:hypothetical protein
MQSTDTKKKRSRKSAEEAKSAQVESPVTGSEEVTKTTRRKSATAKPAPETTSSAKQHRGSAKKTVTTPEPTAAVPELAAAASASFSGATTVLTQPASVSVSEADIASLAYTFWAERNFEGGSPLEDWLRAERQLKSR